jgi:hypothetical protein
MTRRKFICKLTQTGSVIVAGAFTLARRASAQKVKLRKFVRAVPMKRYPGRVRPLHDIFEQGKWSG